ncbi:MAG: DUF3016 domain-containing protein [Pseudomonadota bacterium]
MNSAIRSMALAWLALASAGSAMASATVTFSHPEQYADLPWSSSDREQVLKDLGQHFDKLAAKLPAGVDLKVEVLDVDLAGRIYPTFRGPSEIRVLRGGADWPQIRLRYSLEQGGKVLSSGEERLSNMMYLDRMNRYVGGDTLRYEKQMLDDWFKEKILKQFPG